MDYIYTQHSVLSLSVYKKKHMLALLCFFFSGRGRAGRGGGGGGGGGEGYFTPHETFFPFVDVHNNTNWSTGSGTGMQLNSA